jgi:GalNAc-alpha-(1->4)-GalNAc-alpha-(1->3)-diNAcBac-PP-undecaprenol alpha-1,4-N-acetyl-D-galactosaminyltransferase
LATQRRQVPVVVSERSDPSRQKLGPIWERLRRQKYKRVDAVVALTDASADYLRGYLGRPVIVIPSAVDRPPMSSDRIVAQANRRIVGLGRLEHEKGFDRLLDAFSDLTVRAPEGEQDWSLRIIGEGSMRGQLESKVQQLGLSDRVSLPGWIRPVWSELSAATIFVLPSRYEGFPSALLEAMAVGVPSLSVDCESGPRAVLTDNVNGLLVPNDLSAVQQSARKQS